MTAPKVISAPSPNHAGIRSQTLGCVLHSTRGGASTVEGEFSATLAWFASPASQVSAHAVIADNGTIANVVDPDYIAWHARSPANETMLGVELVQPNHHDPISEAQYRSLAWWLTQMATRYGFALNATTLPEHRAIPAGIADGKSDIDTPFDLNKVLSLKETP